MDNLEKELSAIMEETGEHIIENYLDIFFEIFDDLKIGRNYPPVPLEVLKGIAVAFANASGYRVILQADIVEPVQGEPRLRPPLRRPAAPDRTAATCRVAEP